MNANAAQGWARGWAASSAWHVKQHTYHLELTRSGCFAYRGQPNCSCRLANIYSISL